MGYRENSGGISWGDNSTGGNLWGDNSSGDPKAFLLPLFDMNLDNFFEEKNPFFSIHFCQNVYY